MKYTNLPKTNIKVSKICLGTMTWGNQNTEAEGHAQLDYAIDHGVNFIKRLRPVKFDWARRDGSFEGKKDYGFIAQELQAIETELNTIEYTNLVDDSNPEKLEAAPFKTYPILVQAVKELIH